MPRQFEDKVVLVAGAGATDAPGWGNGRATAVAFAREGAKVAAVDRVGERAEETCRIIADEGGEAFAIEANITRADEVAAMVASVLARWKRLDVLHHNVGFAGNGDVLTLAADDWDRQMSGNAKSLFLCIQGVLPAMMAQGSGVITSTSSTLAVRYIETPSLAYTAAKAAVEAITRSVAVSHGRYGIRTNCIRIGYMDTPLNRAGWRPQFDTQEAYDAVIADSAKAVPLGRMGTGWDTAAVALFLASDAAAYLNGVVIPVDGGVEHAPVHIASLPISR